MLPHPVPRGGVLETAWITWGGNGARAGRGPPGFLAWRGTVPIVPGVSSDHPSGTTTGAPRGLKKCGLETFRRRVGAPVRRNLY